MHTISSDYHSQWYGVESGGDTGNKLLLLLQVNLKLSSFSRTVYAIRVAYNSRYAQQKRQACMYVVESRELVYLLLFNVDGLLAFTALKALPIHK